ncbi:MAG: lysophospholipid acyltransferase family protein [Ignavibacteriota bacterium]
MNRTGIHKKRREPTNRISLVLSVLRIVGSVIARAAFIFHIRRRVTTENLESAFPALSENDRIKIAKKSYSNIGIVFAEMVYLRYAKSKYIAEHITIANPAMYHSAIAQSRGLVVIAGHFANWEWLALGGSMLLHSNFAVVRKNIQTTFTERFLDKMRKRSGNQLINSADIRKMFRVLQNGNCIALLADQAAPSESVRVDFFGREVPAFEGPARLALRTQAPMLLAECRRVDDGDYLITFHEIAYSDLVGHSIESVKELTVRHTKLLEEIIRRNPEQWLWQHRRWKNAGI